MPDPLCTGCVANLHISPDLETISITDEAYLSTLAKITFTSVRSALDLVYARLAEPEPKQMVWSRRRY